MTSRGKNQVKIGRHGKIVLLAAGLALLMVAPLLAQNEEIVRPGGSAPGSEQKVRPRKRRPPQRNPEDVEVVVPDDARPRKKKEAPLPTLDQLETYAPPIEGTKVKRGMDEVRPRVQEDTGPQMMRNWMMLESLGEVEPEPPPLLPPAEPIYLPPPPGPRPAAPPPTPVVVRIRDLAIRLPPLPDPSAALHGSCESAELMPIVLALCTYWFFARRRRAV
jgi:hypothetical protein